MSKSQPKCHRQPQNQLSWNQIAHLLTSQPQQQQSKKLRLKILDTVFLKKNPNNEASSNLNFSTNGSTNPNEFSSKSLSSKRVIDQRNIITQWCFTTKKGEIMRRKDPTVLTLQHVYDRFCRFSLANTLNAAGPRIVAVGYEYPYNGHNKEAKEKSSHGVGLLRQRVNYTVEQFKREVNTSNNNSSNTCQNRCTSLQCYLRPFEGRDQFYRGVYQLLLDSDNNTSSRTNDDSKNRSEHNNKSNVKVKSDIMVHIIDDPEMANDTISDLGRSIRQFGKTPLHKWIQKEVDLSVLKIVHHLESIICSFSLNARDDDNRLENDYALDLTYSDRLKVVTLTADFILDDNKQLWLACVDNVTIGDEDNLVEQIQMVSKEGNENQIMDQIETNTEIVFPRIITKEREERDNQPINCNGNDQKYVTDSSSFTRPGPPVEQQIDKRAANINVVSEGDDEDHGDVLETKVSLYLAILFIFEFP
jgi:hypothetical protein